MRMATMMAVAVAAVLTATPALAGEIKFWDKNNCRGKSRPFEMSGKIRATFGCTYGRTCENDKYRSVSIDPGVREGTAITVWDNSDGKQDDDWAIISLGQYSRRICVPTFEADYSTKEYTLTYRRRDNLDGKVSRISVFPSYSTR